MKMIILLLLSFSVHANWIPSDKVGVCDSLTVFRLKPDCENHYSKDCSKITPQYNCEYSTLQTSAQLKEQAASCVDADDCQTKFKELTCESDGFRKIKNLDQLEVYCTKFRPEKVVEDASAKTAYESAKASAAADKAAMAMARKRRECGQKVMDRLIVLNGSKADLTIADIRAINSAFSNVKDELEGGSLATARDSIVNADLTGTVITEADRTALIAELDACLPQ